MSNIEILIIDSTCPEIKEFDSTPAMLAWTEKNGHLFTSFEVLPAEPHYITEDWI